MREESPGKRRIMAAPLTTVELIAEGVENERHNDDAYLNGCRFFQGNYISEPIPEEKFLGFIKSYEDCKNEDDALSA